MKPGNQCISGASVGVYLRALGRQSIDGEERRHIKKATYSRADYDRSNSGRAYNNTSEAFHSRQAESSHRQEVQRLTESRRSSTWQRR
ncbi:MULTISPECIES: hypothetical protein [unclassified Synechococcus]|uniref:hypothetical protein n=1 Tax=unclassified Synechococcus TaxID=2626047 RepID=UPI0039B0A7A4